VGSGAIAQGLARTAGEHGDVVLRARSEGSALRVPGHVHELARVVTDIAELRDSEIVVEAVIEDLEVKGELLAELGQLLPDEAVIASTTSALPIRELAAASGRPDRFAGLHVFNPVHRMRLVELAFPPEASDATRARLRTFCEHLDKVPVDVPDSPGFVVNRLLFPYLFDAVRMMERDGLPPEDVDQCMMLGAGHPMGPLALLDFVGLDVAIAIGESIGVEVPTRLRELVATDRLGRKSGAGFYEYEAG
jgi:3-hydroxyacyl-CoA dehydrogenase